MTTSFTAEAKDTDQGMNLLAIILSSQCYLYSKGKPIKARYIGENREMVEKEVEKRIFHQSSEVSENPEISFVHPSSNTTIIQLKQKPAETYYAKSLSPSWNFKQCLRYTYKITGATEADIFD